ncbi:MAG: DUF2061 domain-containing protein [Elusimicrobiota bacterium]
MDSKERSLFKSVSWRFIALIVLALVSYMITRSVEEMSLITVLYTAIQILLYFCHERLWEKIKWGKIEHPLSDLPVNRKPSPEDMKIVSKKLKELGYID